MALNIDSDMNANELDWKYIGLCSESILPISILIDPIIQMLLKLLSTG